MKSDLIKKFLIKLNLFYRKDLTGFINLLGLSNKIFGNSCIIRDLPENKKWRNLRRYFTIPDYCQGYHSNTITQHDQQTLIDISEC